MTAESILYIFKFPKVCILIVAFIQVEPNILIAVKLDSKNGYFYVATMHEISQLKLTQRIRNGRLRKVDKR